MPLSTAIIHFLVYGLPLFFFTYMATDIILRNYKKMEHILLSIISLCYILLFIEEYIRNQVDISYSPWLSSIWFSSVGILIPGLGLHFLVKFTHLDRSMSRWIYPHVFYLPIPFVMINIATDAQLISAQQFIASDLWNLPVYNSGYFFAMTASIIANTLYLIPLAIACRKSTVKQQKSIYQNLIIGVIVSIIAHIILGYFNFGASLPPYPYLYSGIIWCYFLRRTMNRHDFLNLYDKRYEKLFNMNPDAIMLADFRGNIKNANPKAQQLFDELQLSHQQFINLIDINLKMKVYNKHAIYQHETEIIHQDRRIVLLVNIDYVWFDNEQHIILIMRDITMQKEQQEEILFLAYHDPLTRLPNRRYFHKHLDDAIAHSSQNDEKLVLLLIDLDRIKMLNDTYGHSAGDEALLTISSLLIKLTENEQGMAARMGGDEFVMFLRNIDDRDAIDEIIAVLQHSYKENLAKYHDLALTLSIGVSFFPADATTGDTLIYLADEAMYEMKRIHHQIEMHMQ